MIFTTTLSQMAFLFSLIVIGYILVKMNFVPENTELVLSRLENFIFLPALVMGNFVTNFTVSKLFDYSSLIIASIIIEVIFIGLSLIVVRFCSKDKYIRNIYLYGLAFSNFGFMGNAVVSALFPEYFSEYIVFTMVLWVWIYLWGVPSLLMGDSDKRPTFKENLKKLLNPMFICMIIGMIIGLSNIKLPDFAGNLINSLGDCMSPVAMLLTGMTVARSKFKEIISHKGVYVITFVRLVIFPLIFIGLSYFIPAHYDTVVICGLCAVSMPLGLSTIVVPAAYGKDTRVAAGMALVSHALSCITIPIMFSILW
ncbi:MAG: AEC family transporter [Clostridia bacterium]|nr:AEC family transporter [Clostridia bacterium]